MSEKLDPTAQESWDYLLEVVADYQRYMSEIGSLGLAAPNMLYYRDEIQEGLQEFKGDKRIDFRSVWERVKHLDAILEKRAKDLVNEIGHANFRQYRLINDPPKAHWWWYLDRVTPATPAGPPSWQFWRHIQAAQTVPAELPSEAEPDPDQELPPAEFEAKGDGRPSVK